MLTKVWDVIDRASKTTTVILTTHSMEEAEALCARIGIMSHGVLRCLASPLRLKQLYGPGFKLSLNYNPQDLDRVCEYIETILPTGWKKIESFATSTSYDFPRISGALFSTIESNQKTLGILDWNIGILYDNSRSNHIRRSFCKYHYGCRCDAVELIIFRLNERIIVNIVISNQIFLLMFYLEN
jgi:ABC-type multidrug transport system ATPase subunit